MNLPIAPAEAIVLRHALMSYRNGIAQRNRDDPPYPMLDGWELITADDLIARLDEESAAILHRDRQAAYAPAELAS